MAKQVLGKKGTVQKVLFIARNFQRNPEKQPGAGLTAFFSAVSKYKNYEVSVISCDDAGCNAKEGNPNIVRVPSSLIPRDVERLQFYRDLWLTRRDRLSLVKDISRRHIDFLRVAKEAARMLPQVDVIHWFELFIPFASAFRFFSKLYGVRNYLTLFGFQKRYRFHYQLLRASLGGFNQVAVTTGALEDFVSETLGLPANKIVHVHQGVDLSLFKPPLNKGKLKEAAGIKPHYKVISWFGPIDPSPPEDFHYLLNAVDWIQQEVPASMFIFAFKHGVPSDYSPPNENVRFLDNLPDIINVLNISDLIVLPSSYRDECVSHQPLTIIEAMATGVPTITMDKPGLNETILNGVNGILVQGIEDIPQAVVQLCQQEGKLNELSRNARTFAEEQFDIEAVAQAYIRLWSNTKR